MAVFIDSWFFIALFNSSDQYHQRARELVLEGPRSGITTKAVLVEVGNTLSRKQFRSLAAALVESVIQDPEIEVIPATSELFHEALRLFASRQDKEWGMTDCISFVVMEQRGLREALTADRHFTEAGFHALMA